MWNHKTKAITFSYDDGVTQDRRLVELFNQYGLKSTFNLNSELLGRPGTVDFHGKEIRHDKIQPEEVAALYAGHEVAAHTLTHPNLTQLEADEIVRQVEHDRENLTKLSGQTVVGMAYPCGGVNHDQRVADMLGERTRIQYARTITSCYSFTMQSDLLQLDPTVHHLEWEQLDRLAERFLSDQSPEPKLFYIWGHSYEFDFEDTWERFQRFCEKIAGKSDVFYGANREVLLDL